MTLPWVIGVGLLFLLGLGATHRAKASNVVGNVDLKAAELTQWLPFVKVAAATAGIPWEFAYAWMGIESGGNPCAVGNRLITIPPGNYPREVGLFQIYNPDDFKELGIKPDELCAYCVRPEPGKPNPQKLSRQLTPNEIGRAMGIGMKFIGLKRKDADKYMMLSGVKWPVTSPDYWRMVKLPHALPVILNTGLSQVTRLLGRPPTNWQEFRGTYEKINPRARFDPAKARAKQEQDGYYRALENAEWTGGQVPDSGTGETLS